ncbi:MAG: hypothetical protein ACO1RX_21750 [Candidatus Sericytochromatia bacterium]
MPLTSLNIRDPRTQFSPSNPYVGTPQAQRPQEVPHHEPFAQELDERPPQREGRLSQDDIQVEVELREPGQHLDFTQKIQHLSGDQLEANGSKSCCQQLGSFLKATGNHVVLGQGSITNEVDGLVGISMAYAANTLGDISDVSGGDSDPTLRAANMTETVLKTQWFNTGSPVDSAGVAKGKVGGLVGGMGGTLVSVVGTLASSLKLIEGGKNLKFAAEMARQAHLLRGEATQIRGQLQAFQNQLLTRDQALQMVTDLERDIGILSQNVPHLSEQSQQTLQRQLTHLGQIRGALENLADEEMLPALQGNVHAPHRDSESDLESDDVMIRRDDLVDRRLVAAHESLQALSTIVGQQADFRQQLGDVLADFAKLKAGDGGGSLLDGGLGIFASLNGLTNGIMTLTSLGVPTSGTDPVSDLTRHGNQIASGLITTQLIGASTSTVISAIGTVRDLSDVISSAKTLSKAKDFLNTVQTPPVQIDEELGLPPVQHHPVQDAAILVRNENQESLTYKSFSLAKNVLMTVSGLSLMSGVAWGATAVGAVFTPIGWGTGVLGLGSGLISAGLKYRHKDQQLENIQRAENTYREDLHTLNQIGGNLGELRQQQDTWQHRLGMSSRELGLLRSELQEAEQALGRCEHKIEKHQSQLKELEGAYQDLDGRRGLVEKTLKKTEKNLDSVQAEKSRVKTERQGLLSQQEDLGTQIKHQEQLITATTQQLEQVKLQLAERPLPIEQDLENPSAEENPRLALEEKQKDLETLLLSQTKTRQKLQDGLSICDHGLEAANQQLRGLSLDEQSLGKTQAKHIQALQEIDENMSDIRHELGQIEPKLNFYSKNYKKISDDLHTIHQRIVLNERDMKEAQRKLATLDENLLTAQDAYQQASDVLATSATALRQVSPKAAVETLIDALKLPAHNPHRQEAETFLGDVLGFKGAALEQLREAEPAYAAELLIAKMNIAYLS